MDILKRLLMIAYAGEGAGGGADPKDPAADPAADPAVDPAADPAADPAVDPAQAEHGNKGKVPWYMKRIHEETNKRVAAEQAADTARKEAEAVIAARADPAADPKAVRQAPPAQNFDQAVEAAASKKVLYADTNDVLAAGRSEFKDFDQSIHVLNAIGLTTDDIVASFIAVDKTNTHKILDKLAKDPEKAASLVGMDPLRRTAEITRLSMAEQPKGADPASAAVGGKIISGAPKPKPAVDPAAGVPDNDGLGDDVDDKTWSQNFDKLQPLRRTG